MNNLITRLMQAVRLFSVFDFIIFKICLLSIGILLGIYFAGDLSPFSSAIWVTAILTAVFLCTQLVKYLIKTRK